MRMQWLSLSGQLLSSTKGRVRPRLCEHALEASKTDRRDGCLCNQRAEARMTLVSYRDIRNAVWAALAV